MADWDRPLTAAEQRWVDRSRETARVLYDGKEVPHRSCGIAMAETFGRDTPAYQALRRGGITGFGPCGVALSGRLVLGEILGDPDPTGPTTPELKAAIADYDARLSDRVRRASCNELVEGLGDFTGPVRHDHCTKLAAETAALVAEVLARHGVAPPD
jgi:hypothetical protein